MHRYRRARHYLRKNRVTAEIVDKVSVEINAENIYEHLVVFFNAYQRLGVPSIANILAALPYKSTNGDSFSSEEKDVIKMLYFFNAMKYGTLKQQINHYIERLPPEDKEEWVVNFSLMGVNW